MDSIEHATLTCASCLTECDHEVHYAGRLVAGFTCSNCGARVQIDVVDDYLPDLGRRLRTKPGRMLRRFRKHPVSYTLTLPVSIATKPLKVVGELRTAMGSAEHRAPGIRAGDGTAGDGTASDQGPAGDQGPAETPDRTTED